MVLDEIPDSKINPSTVKPIRLPRINQVILISSGKGGVGKSTISADLSLCLSQRGYKVGLLDADLHGPSINELFQVDSKPLVKDKRIKPLISGGVKLLSIGFVISKEKPLAWKGYMLHGVIRQLLELTDWGSLDYLIIDQPPGTGDTHMALMQLLPKRVALVITTASPLSVSQVQRTLSMYREADLPVLGLIENMSTVVCRECNATVRLFPEGLVNKLADDFEIPLISSIPWTIKTKPYAGLSEDKAYNEAINLVVMHLENIY